MCPIHSRKCAHQEPLDCIMEVKQSLILMEMAMLETFCSCRKNHSVPMSKKDTFEGIFRKHEQMKTPCASYGIKTFMFSEILSNSTIKCQFSVPICGGDNDSFSTYVKLRLITVGYLHFPVTLKFTAKLLSFCFNCPQEGLRQVKAIRLYSPFTEIAPAGRMRNAFLHFNILRLL